MYQVLIVEDDPMVAEINRQYIARNRELAVAAVFPDGESALAYLDGRAADLIILDLLLPGMGGAAFLQQARCKGFIGDVIVVTAAGGTSYVRRLSAFGALDYLLKPFQYSRFQTAVNRFLEKREVLDGGETQTQEALDRLFLPHRPEQEDASEKGIQPATLRRVRGFLTEQRGKRLTIEEIAAGVSLSRVTVRRYMNYLLSTGEVVGSTDYATGGRPSSIFAYLG